MHRLIPAALAIVCLVFTACDDSGTRPSKTPATSNYKDLSEPWHVLANLERAYDDQNINRIEELMDDSKFVFYLDPGDVGGPYSIPDQWDYTAEIQATTNMFSGAGGLVNNPILTIELTLFDVETVEWVGIVNHPDFPGEALQQATVLYDYFMDTSKDVQYITGGSPAARLIVRNVDGKWKLVRWYDQWSVGLLRAPASTEETTWGKIKAIYQQGEK